MPPRKASPPSSISAQRNENKLNRRVSPTVISRTSPPTFIYSPSNVTPSSNDVIGKRTLFLNPFHERDENDMDTYSIPDEFTSMILNGGTSDNVQLLIQTEPLVTEDSKKREPSRRTSRKQVNYNEQDSNDEEEEEEKETKRKKKRVVKEKESDSESMYVDDDEGGVATCVRVSSLPKILEGLMSKLDPNVTLDTYGIQTLLLNCAMDNELITSEEILTKFCQQVMLKNNEFRIRGLKSWQSDTSIVKKEIKDSKKEEDEDDSS